MPKNYERHFRVTLKLHRLTRNLSDVKSSVKQHTKVKNEKRVKRETAITKTHLTHSHYHLLFSIALAPPYSVLSLPRSLNF